MKLLNYLFVFLDLLERKDLEKERFTMPNSALYSHSSIEPLSFLSKLCSGSRMDDRLGMNFPQKLGIPRNDFSSVVFFGAGAFTFASTG